MYNLVKTSTENGWNNYTARYAVKNLTNKALYVDSTKYTHSASYVNYYAPASGVVVETSEGYKYPVIIGFYSCSLPEVNVPVTLFSFAVPPGVSLTQVHMGVGATSCLGMMFKVPETMKPVRLVLFTGATSQQTVDLTAVPAAAEINNPAGTLSLPTTVKGAPFEITIEPPSAKFGENGNDILFSFKTTIKNTNLAGDMKWQKLDRALTMSKSGSLDGIEIEGKDSIKSDIVIGPGQSKTATLYQLVPRKGFTPGPRTLYFYTGTEWVSIQVNLQAP